MSPVAWSLRVTASWKSDWAPNRGLSTPEINGSFASAISTTGSDRFGVASTASLIRTLSRFVRLRSASMAQLSSLFSTKSGCSPFRRTLETLSKNRRSLGRDAAGRLTPGMRGSLAVPKGFSMSVGAVATPRRRGVASLVAAPPGLAMVVWTPEVARDRGTEPLRLCRQ